jgi:hypothetical protein
MKHSHSKLKSLTVTLALVAAWALLSTPAALWAAETNSGAESLATRPRPTGLFVHDPSTVVKQGSEYWFFSTGNGIVSRHSLDLLHWQAGPSVVSVWQKTANF